MLYFAKNLALSEPHELNLVFFWRQLVQQGRFVRDLLQLTGIQNGPVALGAFRILLVLFLEVRFYLLIQEVHVSLIIFHRLGLSLVLNDQGLYGHKFSGNNKVDRVLWLLDFLLLRQIVLLAGPCLLALICHCLLSVEI